MAIDKIGNDGLKDEVTTNPEFSGTEAAKMPIGTTAQRASAAHGDIRFNSTLSLMEYYDGSIWKAIDSPPVISSISPTTESDGSANITLTGSNFQSGATVQFIGNDGTTYNSPSVTVNSSTEVVATTPSTPLSVANEPYDIKLSNTSGLSGTLADALDAGGVPSWTTAAGTILTIYDSARSSLSVTAAATDPDGDTVSYAIASGDSLPSGLSLNSSTGAITGSTSAVGSDTTTTFDLEASTTSGDTVSRTFNIIQKAPTITSYTSTGSGTFSVPSGLAAVDVLVVAAGGHGGQGNTNEGGGGGGAGGLIYRPAFPVTPGGSVSYSVGSAGSGGNFIGDNSYPNPVPSSFNGNDSTFGTLTAKGGGAGGHGYEGSPGGSGGGGTGFGAPNTSSQGVPQSWEGGNGIQPQQPGDSGQSQYGFGNPGGSGKWSMGAPGQGGAGGGAGGAGNPGGTTSGDVPEVGGIGKSYSISGSSVTYAVGGDGRQGVGEPNYTGQNGTANRGNAGQGGISAQTAPGTPFVGGSGGSGIVIVKY